MQPSLNPPPECSRLPAPLSIRVERVLLLAPPVYDSRLHWADWQQPTGLLRLSTVLRARGAEVRLLNALEVEPGRRLRRQKVDLLNLDGQEVVRWRYGRAQKELERTLRTLAEGSWHPELVVVECLTTFWWEGAAEAIRSIRSVFPHARVALIGAYAALAPEHAREHSGADDVIETPLTGLSALAADLSLLAGPRSTYISLDGGRRTSGDIADEIRDACGYGVARLAFTELIAGPAAERLADVLEEVLQRGIRVRMHALGNVRPSDLLAHPELPALMRRGGFSQICFADDRDQPADGSATDELVSSYHRAAELCHLGGFPTRTECLVGAVSLGRPGEDLEERARAATLVSHAIGAVIVWPYQPAPSELPPSVPLEMQNGKLFPFRQHAGHTYRDYLHVLGLGVVLNAKYRDHTFDFLGDSMIARLFRDSIARDSWIAHESIKGPVQLPVLRR